MMYLERCTAHSSFWPSKIAPTRRTMAASLGPMPTTSVRRLISPTGRSIGLVECSLEAHVGEQAIMTIVSDLWPLSSTGQVKPSRAVS